MIKREYETADSQAEELQNIIAFFKTGADSTSPAAQARKVLKQAAARSPARSRAVEARPAQPAGADHHVVVHAAPEPDGLAPLELVPPALAADLELVHLPCLPGRAHRRARRR